MSLLIATIAIVMAGVMAGIYFSFSVFVMKALANLPAPEGAKAMNEINEVIVKTLFLPLFFGSTLLITGAGFWHLFYWQDGRSLMVVMAAIMYLFGMFGVTVLGNVPLNNRLKKSEESEQVLVQFWAKYFLQWTRLNHVRTISCIAACALLVLSVS